MPLACTVPRYHMPIEHSLHIDLAFCRVWYEPVVMKPFCPSTPMIHGNLYLRQSTLIWEANILFLSQIFALLFVRGKPYSGQDIVSELLGRDGGCGWLWLGPLTSFSWNIIVPVGLLVLSISSFKSGHYREVSGSNLLTCGFNFLSVNWYRNQEFSYPREHTYIHTSTIP